MSSFCKVIVMGNLTRDVELRYLPKGTAVAAVAMATNRRWKTESGEEREEVCFVDCVSFGRQAETLGQYLHKGDPLLIEGRLRLETWEKDGQKHSKLKVIVESFTFVGGKGGGDRQPAAGSQERRQGGGESARAAGRQQAAGDAAEPPKDPDEIPF
jgi:single-strand DNA-binding protein